jgi:hypothetical protein
VSKGSGDCALASIRKPASLIGGGSCRSRLVVDSFTAQREKYASPQQQRPPALVDIVAQESLRSVLTCAVPFHRRRPVCLLCNLRGCLSSSLVSATYDLGDFRSACTFTYAANVHPECIFSKRLRTVLDFCLAASPSVRICTKSRGRAS